MLHVKYNGQRIAFYDPFLHKVLCVVVLYFYIIYK